MAHPTGIRQTLSLVSLLVRDYDEAIAFYCQVLGFDVVEDSAIDSGKRWVVVRPAGGGTAGILLAKASGTAQSAAIGNQTGGRVFLFLHTNDLDRDHSAYKGRGVVFTREPATMPYGRVAVFQDLYGNLWDLIEPTGNA